MNIFGFFPNFTLFKYRTKWIRIRWGPFWHFLALSGTFWGPDVMSIHKRQQFHLTTVDFWPKTLFFRTQQVKNSMIQLILFDMLFSKENKDDFSREMFVLFLLDVNKFDIFQYFDCYSWWFAETWLSCVSIKSSHLNNK